LGGKNHTMVNTLGSDTFVSGVNVRLPKMEMFAALTFCGRRRSDITVGKPAGCASDAAMCRCDAVLAAGTVMVAPYPPANGPSESEVDNVVLVVKVPDALAELGVGEGVGIFAVGEIVPLLESQALTMLASANAPMIIRNTEPPNNICRMVFIVLGG
jgi:hypothetical protein